MTVRVWMKPSELGEQGYTVDFDADDWRRLKDGAIRLDRWQDDDKDASEIVGRVEAGRWDAVIVVEEAR